jgi:hypothetical protein
MQIENVQESKDAVDVVPPKCHLMDLTTMEETALVMCEDMAISQLVLGL